jgi:hypothetical protein
MLAVVVAIPAGLLIGLSLGALGGGGSILASGAVLGWATAVAALASIGLPEIRPGVRFALAGLLARSRSAQPTITGSSLTAPYRCEGRTARHCS